MNASTPLGDLAQAILRATNEAQARLDALGRQAHAQWDDTGIPPTWYRWSDVLLHGEVSCALGQPSNRRAVLHVGGPSGPRASLRLRLREVR